MLLSKLVAVLISPLGTALALACVALLLAALRRSRGARVAGFAAVAWLWLWSTPVASVWLRSQLEQQHPAQSLTALPAAQAIVVLGGAVSPPTAHRPFADLGGAVDRLWHAAHLYHAGKAPLIVLSGGSDPEISTTTEAVAMRALLLELGVPAAAVLLEEQSRNTRQNAAFSAALLHERGIDHVLLVTSALHMERARRFFVQVGLRVEPAPTDYEAETYVAGVLRYLPDTDALDGSSRAFKEALGQAVAGWSR